MNVSKEPIPSQASAGTQEYPLHNSASTLSPYTEACGPSGPKFPGTRTTPNVQILLGPVTTSFLALQACLEGLLQPMEMAALEFPEPELQE